MRHRPQNAALTRCVCLTCVGLAAASRLWISGHEISGDGGVAGSAALSPPAPSSQWADPPPSSATPGSGGSATADDIHAPHVDIDCAQFTNVCLDQGTFIFYDDQYLWQASNYERVPSLDLNRVKAHSQTAGDSNTDADPRAHDELSHVWSARARSAVEGSPALQDPRFSTRTVPVVLYTRFMYNIGEFMRMTASAVEEWFATGRIADDVSYVLSTPGGQGLHAYHTAILGAYSKYEVTTLADFSRRAVPCARVNYTAEGTMQQCFAKAHVCVHHSASGGQVVAAGRRVVQRWAAEIPVNPLGFDLRPSVLKVLIATRSGGVRTILNMPELLDACSSSPPPEGYARVECQPHSFARVQPVTRAEFMRNLGVMQSVDVLVNIHGAEGANAYFAPPGVANLELRPCGFGTRDAAWVNSYYPAIHKASGDQILFFAVNVEDPSACRPGEHEQRRIAAGNRSPGYFDARDRHVALPPDAFVQALARVATYLRRPRPEFQWLRDAGMNFALFKGGKLTWGGDEGFQVER